MSDIKLAQHPYLRQDEFMKIIRFHDAIDSILSLHYSSHTSLITAHELFRKVASLLNARTKIENFLCVLMVEPNCYKLIEPKGVTDYSPCYVSIFQPINEFNLLLHSRKSKFIDSMNKWIESHQDIGYFNIPKVEDVIRSHSTTKNRSSPSKITKPRLVLKNDASKFSFKQRDETAQRQNNNGLSLLERIKLKEQTLKQQQQLEPVEVQRQKYLEGKLPSMYNILHQIKGNGDKMTLTMTKLTQMIKDSIDYPIHEDEIHDCLYLMEKKLDPITITTRNDLTVVKVDALDRSRDLKILTNK